MKSVFLSFGFFSALSLSLVWVIFPDAAQFGGFLFGLGLFSANLWILTQLARRLLSAGQPESPRKPAAGAFSLLMFLKLFLLGGGLYFGLIVFSLSAWFLVAGAVSGLVFVTVATYWSQERVVRPEIG